MSFRAEFHIDGKMFRALHCTYTIARDIDFSGRPSSEPRGGTIQVEVESTDDTGFNEWIINPYQTKEGEVHFFKRNDKAVMKKVTFKDGYLVSFTENFSNTGDTPMTQTLLISANELGAEGSGSAVLINTWPM